MSDKMSTNGREQVESINDIKGDFSDFDRAFFQYNEENNRNSLLLFSEKRQMFICLDLDSRTISNVNIHGERQYQQVEVYDKKIFCIDRKETVMDVFFFSKKQQLYHKRTFRFTNRKLRLKENFQLTVWEHNEADMIYRCLLGPLEDGRYMNFDLLRHYFDCKINDEQIIDKVICINMTIDNKRDASDYIVLALDEARGSFFCYDRSSETFFENNDFSGGDSYSLELPV